MISIHVLPCRFCGKYPVWLNTPIGAGIGCGSSAVGGCATNTVSAPSMVIAADEWNWLQEAEDDE